MAERKKRHVRKGDQVKVLAGKYKGQQGELIEVLVKSERVRVRGLALVKRHLKADPNSKQPGGIIERLGSIAISNVAPIDPKSGQATRVRMRVQADGKKVRIASRSGEPIGGGA